MATDLQSLKEAGDLVLFKGVFHAQTFQHAYLTAHGRYAQCVKQPETIPVDGVAMPVDKLAHPDYQTESWLDLGFDLEDQSPVSFRIDIYDGPLGQDWCAVVVFKFANSIYTRSVAENGTEAHTTDWVESVLDGSADPPL